LGQQIGKDEGILKKYYEKSIAMDNPDKAKAFEDLADEAVKKLVAKRQELASLEAQLETEKAKEIDYDVFKDLQKGLAHITKQEIEKFTGPQEKKLDFIRTYIRKVKVAVLADETDVLRQSILRLRDKGIYRQENKALRELYFTVANKEHALRGKTAIQMIALSVEFVNNFVLPISFPYFHERPDMAITYLNKQKTKIIKIF